MIIESTLIHESKLIPEKTLRNLLHNQSIIGHIITLEFDGPEIGEITKAWYEKGIGIKILAEVEEQGSTTNDTTNNKIYTKNT